MIKKIIDINLKLNQNQNDIVAILGKMVVENLP